MIVYCDSSFLVSWLNEDDSNHNAARELAKEFDQEAWVLCEVHALEIPAAVRAAVHRQDDPIPEHVARKVINRFDRAWTGRKFQRKALAKEGLFDSVTMARSLGDCHGWKQRHTTLDLWHLGAAWALSSGAFLTFDQRQKRIAQAMGMA